MVLGPIYSSNARCKNVSILTIVAILVRKCIKSWFYYNRNPNVKPTLSQVRTLCGDSDSCTHDYYVTNDVTVAEASKKAEDNFQHLQESQVKGKTIVVALFELGAGQGIFRVFIL